MEMRKLDSDAVLAVVGTLLGALLGTLGTYAVQRGRNKHETQERVAALRRETYVSYISAAHRLYVNLNALTRSAVAENWPADRLQEELLRKAPSDEALQSFESVRLIASPDVAAAAANLQRCLRRDPALRTRVLSGSLRRGWQDRYWEARRGFTDSVRRELGFEPLDWETASVNVSRTAGADGQRG